MHFATLGLIALVLFAAPTRGLADSFTDSQPFHTQVGQNCGEGGTKRTYSKSEYAKALAEAQKALKSAKDSADRRAAIQQNINDINDCKKQGFFTPPPPPVFGCGEMIYEYQRFVSQNPSAAASGTPANAKVAKQKAAFAKSFAPCLRKALGKCVDPNDTKQFYEAVNLLEMGRSLGFFKTLRPDAATQYPLSAAVPIPGGDGRLSFCTDSDYTCHGKNPLCADKLDSLGQMISFK